MYVQICNAPISLPFIQSYSVPLTCMYKYAVRRYHYRLYNHTVCHSHVCTNMQCADITTVYTIIQCATRMHEQLCSAPLPCMNNYAVRRYHYRLYNHTMCHLHEGKDEDDAECDDQLTRQQQIHLQHADTLPMYNQVC